MALVAEAGHVVSQEKPSSLAKAGAEELAAGKQAYAASCSGCHGLDGKGGERAPDIATRPKVRQLSDKAILKILQNGVPNTSMPSFQFLGVEKQRAVGAYLRTLQGVATAAAIAGDAQRGKTLFFGSANCSSCHMSQGQGGFFGSDLTRYARGRSADVIRAAILSPNLGLDPRRRTVVATLANGQTLRGIARNEDNFSLQLLAADGALHLLYKSALAKLTYLEESPMPADYGTKLTSSQLDDLVKFLATTAEAQSYQHGEDEQEDD